MTEKELAAITSENGIVHRLAIYVSYGEPTSVYDDALSVIHALLAHIEALKCGGTFKLLREAQARIAQLEGELDQFMQCPGCDMIIRTIFEDEHECRYCGNMMESIKRSVADGEG